MEKDKRWPGINGGFFIMIGLTVVGILFYFAVTTVRSFDRSVSVKGLCEMEVTADRVIWPLVYNVVGNDVTLLYGDIKRTNKIIVEFLKSNGIEEDEITVSAPKLVDTRTEYGENKPYNYKVTAVLTVYTDKVDIVKKLLSEQSDLLNKGVALTGDNWEFKTQFIYTGLNNIKPQMIEKATMNARITAEKFAKDSNSKLGKIKKASQGQFSVTNRDENTPYIKNVRVVTSIDYFLKD